MTELENDFIPNGDNGETIDTDYQLWDFGEVLEMVKKMPKLDLVLKHYNQYSDKRYFTWCSQMWAINAMATIENYDFTWKEISEIYDWYEKLWWRPWIWWARSMWLKSIATRWNKKFPNNKMLYFIEDIFSEATEIVFDKLGIVWLSIKVDGNYWKDIRADLKVDWDKYLTSLWHSTTMMKVDWKYICVDSVPRSYSNKDAMIYEFGSLDKVRKLIKSYNIRADINIIVMEKWLKQTDHKEQERLIEFKKNLGITIEANSKLRNLTKDEVEKTERNRQNEYNRAKFKVVNAMIWL